MPTYRHCDNRILRLNRQIFAEVLPTVQQAEEARVFVLYNRVCLDNFFKSLHERDWRWVRHLRVGLFVGWGDDGKDDWFLCQSQRWAMRHVAGALEKYGQGRSVVVLPADEIKEDSDGRRSLVVDVYLA
ncbi:hypothetical protein A1O3_06754 [Capronia epimyces CBS 606.96]|uniref:Uncharacterized protein n=1 Tax=Capronia epimyces CBS 606.96 TaxID=1182542 RepID=W9XQX2_9EURO|nr:uncharacterized protein A1O3_06754 [Capronia epimyces CBS 606.96]EXJ82937.1 hypothetical protein A1O3_06754 [Capronia epimyces CBS 606.96]